VAERLAGKVALVSGGARGMGASHVRTLVAEGAKVVFGDILDDEGKAVAAELGDAVRYVHLDVTRPEHWESAVATADVCCSRAPACSPMLVAATNAAYNAMSPMRRRITPVKKPPTP